MFDIMPQGKLVPPNSNWIKRLEQNGFCHWIIYQDKEGELRALYNGLTYWVKVFRITQDEMIHLFDLTTQPEEDEETGEVYLPSVSEGMIREFLGWDLEVPIEYR